MPAPLPCLRFPHSKKAKSPRCRQALLTQNRKRPTVLVVNDMLGVRVTLRVVLKSEYHAKVIEAESNAQAFRLAERRKFDLVISDYGRITGGNGLEFLREFKSRYPQTPVIMQTAQVERIRLRARRLGASAYIQKMITLPRLRIIKRVLSARL